MYLIRTDFQLSETTGSDIEKEEPQGRCHLLNRIHRFSDSDWRLGLTILGLTLVLAVMISGKSPVPWQGIVERYGATYLETVDLPLEGTDPVELFDVRLTVPPRFLGGRSVSSASRRLPGAGDVQSGRHR